MWLSFIRVGHYMNNATCDCGKAEQTMNHVAETCPREIIEIRRVTKEVVERLNELDLNPIEIKILFHRIRFWCLHYQLLEYDHYHSFYYNLSFTIRCDLRFYGVSLKYAFAVYAPYEINK